MLDRDNRARFDSDPNLDKPLRPETLDFMQRLKESKDFKYFLLNQLSGDRMADGSLVGNEQLGVWGEGFVSRIFNASSPAEVDRLLVPWVKWGESYRRLNSEYYATSNGGSDSYKKIQAKFKEIGVPEELREQMGEMSEEAFIFNAEFYLFSFTESMKESIDMMEGLPRPVSAETIFRVQRIMGQPIYPKGGLVDEERLKPDVRFGWEDGTPQVDHWNKIEVGSHISTVRTGDDEVDSGDWSSIPGESGIVYGFSLMGAGDRMFFSPSVGHIALLVKDDKTDFLKSVLVCQARLDSEAAEEKVKQS